MLKRIYSFIFALILLCIIVTSCKEENEKLGFSVQENEKITYVFNSIEYTEFYSNVATNNFENPEIAELLLHSNIKLYVRVDPYRSNTYYLYTNREKFYSGYSKNFSKNERQLSNCGYSTFSIRLYLDKNFSPITKRVKFLYNNNSSYYEKSLANVLDDSDDYVDFRNKTSSLTVQRGNVTDCGIWTLTLIDLEVTTPTLENRKELEISVGATNNTNPINFPDLSILKFDNKADKFTLSFYD